MTHLDYFYGQRRRPSRGGPEIAGRQVRWAAVVYADLQIGNAPTQLDLATPMAPMVGALLRGRAAWPGTAVPTTSGPAASKAS